MPWLNLVDYPQISYKGRQIYSFLFKPLLIGVWVTCCQICFCPIVYISLCFNGYLFFGSITICEPSEMRDCSFVCSALRILSSTGAQNIFLNLGFVVLLQKPIFSLLMIITAIVINIIYTSIKLIAFKYRRISHCNKI